ncbi:MAG: YIP1 family protein [Puniceicoccales bacterium]|nr:YIP1 family protein [Puniceicoccales bacterium]
MNPIHVARNSAPLGTFTEEEIKDGLNNGRFLLTDLAWRIGMAQWKTLSAWEEFGVQQRVSLPGAVPIPGEPETPEPAWERSAEIGAWRAFRQTIWSVLRTPAKVFSSLTTSGEIGKTLLFYIAAAFPSVILAQAAFFPLQQWWLDIWNKVISEYSGIDLAVLQASQRMDGVPPEVASMVQSVQIGSAVVGAVIGVLAGMFILAGIDHLMLLLVRGAKRPFIVTFKVNAYVYGSLAPFTWIPLLGGLISVIWGTSLRIIGLSRAHGISARRAAAAVLIPLIAMGACVGTMFALGATLMGHLRPLMPPSSGVSPAPASAPSGNPRAHVEMVIGEEVNPFRFP